MVKRRKTTRRDDLRVRPQRLRPQPLILKGVAQ